MKADQLPQLEKSLSEAELIKEHGLSDAALCEWSFGVENPNDPDIASMPGAWETIQEQEKKRLELMVGALERKITRYKEILKSPPPGPFSPGRRVERDGFERELKEKIVLLPLFRRRLQELEARLAA